MNPLKFALPLILFSVSLSRGDTLVVPNQYANVDAPGAGAIFPGTESAYQEVFDASSFLNISPDGFLITGFSWRVNNPGQGGNPFDVTLNSAEVLASTTSRSSSSLSPVFSDNIGADQSLVRSPAPVHIGGSFPRNQPSPFSITFSFDKPFRYDPNRGNLLIELHVNSGNGSSLDADLSNPSGHEGVGIVVQGLMFPVGVYGPVTEFSFQSVPEPSSMALAICGLIGILACRAKAGLSKPEHSIETV